MDHALATLNSLADPERGETSKTRDTSIRAYITAIQGLPEESKALLVDDPGQAFELLRPSQNSIGYLYLLDIILASSSLPSKLEKPALLDKVVYFLTRFDPVQIRYAGLSLRSLLDRIASGTLFPPAVAVELLATAILRIDPTGSTFTSTHLHLAKIAVEANMLQPALAVLDKEITSYPSMVREPREPREPRESRDARDPRPLCDEGLNPALYISTATGLTDSFKSGSVLEYNFLRSLAYMSRRDWDRAFAALEQVISHPTKSHGVSKVMVECYKRWILVGLLKSGQTPSLPSYTSGQSGGTYGAIGAAYKEFAGLFVSAKAAELKALAEKRSDLWQEDGTASLIAEVISAYQKWQIINLRNIYTEVAIGQVRQLTSSAQTGEHLQTDEDTVALIQEMLSSGMLQGTLELDGSAGSFLKFGDASAVLTETEFAREIATSHARITTLNQQYMAADERLSEKREYVRHVISEQKRAEKEGPDAGLGFDSQIEDEDLMTGIMAHG